MPTNKPAPRFVPTLTEVVRPGLPKPPPAVDHDELVEQVLQALKPRLEQQLRASLQAVVEQHLRTAAPRMQHDMEEAVEAAVSNAIRRMTQQYT
ncbi:MAG: hypothetical protein Q7T69_14530 [Rhodoferax sp.]|nr:hypothetical protein [Rhodoferax sp.]